MNYLKLLLPFLRGLGSVLKNLFLGFFLMRIGAEKQQLKNYKTEERNLKDVKKISHIIDGMSRLKLRGLLSKSKTKDK